MYAPQGANIPLLYPANSGHCSASSHTQLTGLSALFAMLGRVLGAFFVRGFANLCTQLANGLFVRITACNRCCCCLAQAGTFQIKRNALGHHAAFWFVDTCRCTMQTGCGTGVAGGKAILIDLVHGISIHLFIQNRMSESLVLGDSPVCRKGRYGDVGQNKQSYEIHGR